MPRTNKRQPTPEVCPVCGEDVPSRSLACPECGACHESGWRDDLNDGLGLEDDEFDYGEFIEREFGSSVRPSGIHPIWWITGIVLIIAMFLFYF